MDLAQMTSRQYWLTEMRVMGTTMGIAALKLVGIFLLNLLLQRLLGKAIDRLIPPLLGRVRPATEVRDSRIRTVSSLVKSLGQYLLLFITAVMALRVLDFEVAPIIASAGVVGLAVGFGAQKLVKDVITGFLILLEDQFDVGDTVTIGTNTGTVEEMGMRITRLRDDVGKLIILSNGDISTVINHSRGPLAVAVDVSVAPETPLEPLRNIVESLELPEDDWAERPAIRGVTAMDATRLTIRVAGRAHPGRQAAAEMGLRQALRDAITAAHIKLA
jgi:moderate conductance mechanosensitive channel